MLTRKQVAKTIDHAVLKPDALDQEIIDNCQMGAELGVASICVRPTDVALAALVLLGSAVRVSAVVGFPHGANRPEVKALEARLAIEEGATELDMVMNIGKFLSGDDDFVLRDIAAVVAEAKPRNVLVKVILEVCYLTPQQIARACMLSEAAGADFVKTSTGFGPGGATPEAVGIMLRAVGPVMGVKASGGIRDWATAVSYLEQGCQRLGVGATTEVLDGAPE